IHRMSSQQPKASNHWSTGTFGCVDLNNKKICCISFFCFPCFACNTAKRYGECFCLPLIDQFGLMRVSMRHRYSIEGSIAKDCLLSFCCCPCVWCQMSREMDAREPVTSQAR
uniref:Plac8 onzin related protein 1 n=1 Tax=Sinocyclocheilus rhinocerous TaxID=307959 RepID=A0A673IM85_9TELE